MAPPDQAKHKTDEKDESTGAKKKTEIKKTKRKWIDPKAVGGDIRRMFQSRAETEEGESSKAKPSTSDEPSTLTIPDLSLSPVEVSRVGEILRKPRGKWTDTMKKGEDIKRMLEVIPTKFRASSPHAEFPYSSEDEDDSEAVAEPAAAGGAGEDKSKENPVLKKELETVIQELDALIVRLKDNAINTETIEKGRKDLKVELENVRLQYYQDHERLQNELKNARSMLEEQDVRVQKIVRGVEEMKTEKGALELEVSTVRTRHEEEATRLKNQLRTITTQRDELETRSQGLAEGLEAVRGLNSDMTVELERIRNLYNEEVARLRSEILEMRKYRDDHDVEILKARSKTQDMEAMKAENMGLKHKIKTLESQCMGSNPLAREINAVRAECERIKKERNELRLKVQIPRQDTGADLSEMTEGIDASSISEIPTDMSGATASGSHMRTGRQRLELKKKPKIVKFKVIITERDTLKTEAEKLRVNRQEVIRLKKELKKWRAECDKLKDPKETKTKKK
jgi:chromosome segregation ATPase